MLAGPPVIFVYQPAKDNKSAANKPAVNPPTPTETADTGPVAPPAPALPPKSLVDKVKEQSGTRMELLDIAAAGQGTYQIIGEKDSYPWDSLDNPEECKKTCVKGFHYAYNSTSNLPKSLCVCTNLACLAQKKADLTQKQNAAGTANKKAEAVAIQEAMNKTNKLGKPQIKVILLSFLKGCYINPAGYGEGIRSPYDLIWLEVSPETPENERSIKTLMEAVGGFPEEQLAQLVTELCLYSLAYHGDIRDYKIQTREPLGYLGVKIAKPETAGNG